MKRMFAEREGDELASRPARARGLKPKDTLLRRLERMSRPARARGLKLEINAQFPAGLLSRPARARGLKPSLETDAEFCPPCRAPRGRVD